MSGTADTPGLWNSSGGTSSTVDDVDQVVGGASGTAAIGGSTSIDCSDSPGPSLSVADNCGIASSAEGRFTVRNRNYCMLGEDDPGYNGYCYVFIRNRSESLKCLDSTFGVSRTAVCGAGSVPADPCHQAKAGIGFNLSQSRRGYRSAIPDGVETVTVEFANPGASRLFLQIGSNPDGTDSDPPYYYCYDLTYAASPVQLNATDFVARCWSGDDPGDTWDGMYAQDVVLIVPSNEDSESSFDACLLDVQFNN